MIFAIACGSSGGVDYLAETSTGSTSNTTTVSTKIQVDEVLSKAMIKNKTLTPPEIYVLLSNGSKIVMSDEDGDGVYSADIGGLIAGDVLMVVAKQNSLELRNIALINSQPGTSMDLGITDEDSTALSLVMQSISESNSSTVAANMTAVLQNIKALKTEKRTELETAVQEFTQKNPKYDGVRKQFRETLTSDQGADVSLSNFNIIFDTSGVASLNNVGDDTFVPNFKVGGLSFQQVWVPNQAQGDYDFNITGDITAEVKKYNVYIKVDFVPWDKNASDLDPKTIDFDARSLPIGAFAINEIEAGQTVHFDEVFKLPEDLADGPYAAVFTIDQHDFFPDDNNLQGEETKDDKFRAMVAPATVLVGNPDKPNLRLLETDLENFSYLAKRVDVFDGDVANSDNAIVRVPDFRINIQSESVAFDITQEVKLIFELGVEVKTNALGTDTTEIADTVYSGNSTFDVDPDITYTTDADGNSVANFPTITYTTETQWFQLEFYASEIDVNGSGNKDVLRNTMTYIKNSTGVSFYEELPIGHHYELYLTTEASDALVYAKNGDLMQLRVTLNSDNAVEEWTNNGTFDPKGDNVKTFQVTYLEDDLLDFIDTSVDPVDGASVKNDFANDYSDASLLPASANIQGTLFNAAFQGVEGNSVSIEMLNPGSTQANTIFSNSGNKITVSLSHDGTNITATSSSLAEDFNAAADGVKDIVQVIGEGTTLLTVQAETLLTGGSDGSAAEIRMSDDTTRTDTGPIDISRGKTKTTKAESEIAEQKKKNGLASWNNPDSKPVFYPNKHYPRSIYNADTGEKVSGSKSKVAAGYRLRSGMSYYSKTFKIGGQTVTLPLAFKWGTYNWLRVWLFNYQISIVEANAELDLNIDNITGSHFAYQAIVFNRQVFGNNYSALGSDGSLSEAEVWNTKDDDDVERFAIHKEVKKGKTFWISFVPINVTAGARGSIGIRGAVYVAANNKLLVHAGPYASLHGFAEFSLDLGIARGGVGAEINILTIYQKFAVTAQIQPGKPSASFGFEAPLEISLLDGRIYAFVDVWKVWSTGPWYKFNWHSGFKRVGEVDIINWEGINRSYEWFDPLERTWPDNDIAWVVGSDGLIKTVNSVTGVASDWVGNEYSGSWYKKNITPSDIAVGKYGKKVYVLSSNGRTANRIYSLYKKGDFWKGDYTVAKELAGGGRARYITYGNQISVAGMGMNRYDLGKKWTYTNKYTWKYYWQNHKSWFIKWRTKKYYKSWYKSWYTYPAWINKQNGRAVYGLKQSRNGSFAYSLGWKIHSNRKTNFYTGGKSWGAELAITNSYIYAVATDGTIGRWNHYGSGYRKITGVNAKKIAVGSKRGHLFVVDGNNDTWVRLNPISGNWTRITDGSGYLKTKDIVGQ